MLKVLKNIWNVIIKRSSLSLFFGSLFKTHVNIMQHKYIHNLSITHAATIFYHMLQRSTLNEYLSICIQIDTNLWYYYTANIYASDARFQKLCLKDFHRWANLRYVLFRRRINLWSILLVLDTCRCKNVSSIIPLWAFMKEF